MGDTFQLPPPEPFWFVGSELLDTLLRTELAFMNRLLGDHVQLRSFLDDPAATVSERKTCFIVLANRKVLEMVCEMFAARYEQPSLSDGESNALSATSGLVTIDAPEWVTEMDRVVEALPFHLFSTLPKPLRAARFKEEDAEQKVALREFSTVEQLHRLIETVFDQQLGRLSKRWSVALPLAREFPSSQPNDLPLKKPVKRKAIRTRDKVREKRDRMIAEIDDASETITEFIRLMDERRVAHLPTWPGWPGTWGQAYKDRRLRRLIQQDKYRALERARRKK